QTAQFAEHRTEGRPVRLLVVESGDYFAQGMALGGLHEPGALQDRYLVHDLRLQRHYLANPDAVDVGGNRLEFAAVLRRRVRLHVVPDDIRWTARQEDH